MPSDVGLPPIWLLGSSGYSARAAGEMGLGYAFAAHFSPADPAPAMRAYRESFEPSEDFERPSAILAVSVVCAETNGHAEKLASSMELAWVRIRSGSPGPLPSPEEAMCYSYSPAERRLADAYRSMQVFGEPRAVRARLEELAEHTAADEIMVTTTSTITPSGYAPTSGSPRSSRLRYPASKSPRQAKQHHDRTYAKRISSYTYREKTRKPPLRV
jgi:luciferase family oxidoreductase group 1